MQGKLVNQYMSEKAGMSQIDKEKIAETIQKMTAGSPKTIHEKEMQDKRSLEVIDMLKKCLMYDEEQRDQIKRDWWKEMNQVRQNRRLDRYWAHFDFDMFYIACQLLDRPEMKDKPCAVGGKNSVLSTANYEARKYGLRAAMPTFIAMELCPHVVLFESNFSKYRHYSKIFRGILSKIDPEYESSGLDEVYIDFTDHPVGKTIEQIDQFMGELRQKVFDATGLTVSCGVGANKMLAKIASEQRKPNNQFILQQNGKVIQSFMSSKKIRKIPGIGPVNEFYLKGLGIQTGKDLLEKVDVLTICFSRQSTEFYVAAALGIGSIEHEFKERKSVGKSQTFKVTDDVIFLQGRLKDLCEQVSGELQQLGFLSLNVVFSYQTNSFEKRDKTFNLHKYTDKHEHLFEALVAYMKDLKAKLRLLGVKCTNLIKLEDYRKQQLFNYLGNPKKIEEALEVEKNSADHIRSLMRSDVAERGQYLCPICSEMVDCKGNVALFNKHVDRCLSKGVEVQNVIQDEDGTKMKVKSHQDKSTKKVKGQKKGGTLTEFMKK